MLVYVYRCLTVGFFYIYAMHKLCNVKIKNIKTNLKRYILNHSFPSIFHYMRDSLTVDVSLENIFVRPNRTLVDKIVITFITISFFVDAMNRQQ